jgi:hypothetical protein
MLLLANNLLTKGNNNDIINYRKGDDNMAKFYTYRQNNSGGYFERDKDVDVIVIIEANDYREANDIAEDIGIYFDGCSKGMDCSCCGDRWSDQWDDDDATDTPTIYGEPIEETENWIVYYLDGTKKKG